MAAIKTKISAEFESNLESLTNELVLKLKKLKNCTSVKALGSVPRKTYLKSNTLDIDIFVYYLKFDYEEFLSELKVLFPREHIASKNRGFPYATIALNDKNCLKLKVDVVPCVVQDLFAKDKTELHHLYLMPLLTDDLRCKIREAKKIIKKIGLYNADSVVKGFSGYTIECLILKYQSLLKIPDSLMSFPDPVDSTRNLFASLSTENLQRFHLLKNNGFRSIKKNPVKEVYIIPNAPLSWHYSLKKHPNVVSCIYVSGIIYMETRDVFLSAKRDMAYSNRYWKQKQNQYVYHSVQGGLKKIVADPLIKEYGAVLTKEKSALRVFNYFR